MNSNAKGSHVISKKNSIAHPPQFLLNQLTGRKLQFIMCDREFFFGYI